ncbi:pyridoxamine 5'-phosphate oxidase family protein [Marinactinospora thermotolerans]|uniref:pyridoxamine 5'-phosphate oxidase family protein n=1 Tax=Marinactinospora thermotolerans TaxID=531310 RepID=UPI003D906589
MSNGRASRSPHQRDRIRMSDHEVAAFLAEHRKVQVATVGRNGEPHLSTLFYAMLEGRLAFWTYAASQKVVNLRRRPTMTCLVEDGEEYARLRGVTLYGTAEIHADPTTVLHVGAAVAARMAGVGVEEPGDVRAGLERAGRKRVAVFLSVRRVASWDHTKLMR